MWRICLGHELVVQRGGEELGHAPNDSVAILLLGLLHLGPNGGSRNQIARDLYPQADGPRSQAALRKSLQRLHEWLGEGGIEAVSGRLRLAKGKWQIEPDVWGGAKLEAVLLPGSEHPWLDRLRADWTKPVTQNLGRAVEGWMTAVRQTAFFDRVAARSLLVAGEGFMASMGSRELAELFAATRPSNGLEPYASEYACLWSRQLYNQAEFEAAIRFGRRALKTAVDTGQTHAAEAAACELAFVCMEMGQIDLAHSWLAYAPFRRTTGGNVLFEATRAALLWNSGDLTGALGVMANGRKDSLSSGRTHGLHFLVNYSILAAEAGELDLADEVCGEASSIVDPRYDVVASGNLHLATARRLIGRTEPSEAIGVLKDHLATGDRLNPLQRIYALEAMAEATALAGRHREAMTIWNSVESARNKRLNPRQSRLRRRVRSLCLQS